MSALRTQLEDAVIAALWPLHRAESGGYLHTIAAYSGELTPSRNDEHFQRVTQGALPAVLVTTDSGTYSNHTMGRLADLDTTVELLVASANLRSLEESNQGDDELTSDPGVYQILEDVREKLFRRELGVDGVGWLIPTEERSVMRSADRSIWQMTFAVHMDSLHVSVESEAADYEGIDNEVNFPEDDDGAPANPIVEFNEELS